MVIKYIITTKSDRSQHRILNVSSGGKLPGFTSVFRTSFTRETPYSIPARQVVTASAIKAGFAKAVPVLKAGAAKTIPFLKTGAVKVLPVTKSVLKNGVRLTGFYAGWRACEKAEDALHEAAGQSTEFIMPKQAQIAARERREKIEHPPEATGSDGGGGTVSSVSEDYFSLEIDSTFIPLLAMLGLAVAAMSYLTICANRRPSIEKAAKEFLAIFGLSSMSWLTTRAITKYVEKLDEGSVLLMQSAVDQTEVRFLIGAFVAAILGLAAHKLVQGYKH